MKILISSDTPTAHYFIRLGLAKVFTAMGHEVIMWDIHQKPVFDAFDEFDPDIFIGQTYNINEPIIKCIKERPDLRVIMKAGDWGQSNTDIDNEIYPVLMATDKEIQNTLRLKEETGRPDFVYIHHHEDWLEYTHGQWAKNGLKIVSLMNAADIFEYIGGVEMEEFKSDITFIGGYWPYKAQTLDKFIVPLCQPKYDYNIKIYGNQPWPVPQYCGYIDAIYTKDVMFSATICPNISEPHSQVFGYDVIERPFKSLSNKCFVISDDVEGMRRIFNNDEIVFAKSPEDFFAMVEHYVRYPDERLAYIQRGYEKVIESHTYFSRVEQILRELGMVEQAELCSTTYKDIRGKLKL